MTLIARFVFEEDGKLCMRHFVWVSVTILQYQKIDVSKGTDINKTSASKKCMLCH